MSQRHYRKPHPDEPLRHARSCYDHLAGVAGIQLSDALLRHGWIAPITDDRGTYQPAYTLTDSGRAALEARGVAIPSAAHNQRRFAYACPDWTEPGAHVGGALGAAILDRLVAAGVVTRMPGDRTLHISGDLTAWIDGAMPGSTSRTLATARR
ncbi:MAG TPA: hypothetical protein VF201_06555 [Nitrolancea sp.]